MAGQRSRARSDRIGTLKRRDDLQGDKGPELSDPPSTEAGIGDLAVKT